MNVSFAADIAKQLKQLILVLRECVTSFMATNILLDKCHEGLRDGLIRLCVPMRSLDNHTVVIRTYPAPGFKALAEDELKH